MSQFLSFGYRHPGSNDEQPHSVITGPPVIVTGWIPFHAPWASKSQRGFDLGKFCQAPSVWRVPLARLAAKAMFLAGNPKPPTRFESTDALEQFAATGEYRALLAVDNVKAILNKSGRFIGVEGTRLSEVGCTPVRTSPTAPRILLDGTGEEKITYGILPTQHVRVHTWQTFKMSRWVDVANTLLTGARATSGRIELLYTFSIGGQVTIEIASTSIPSQMCGFGWKSDINTFHDMTRAEASDIAAFFGAGKCRTAPYLNRVSHKFAGSVALL